MIFLKLVFDSSSSCECVMCSIEMFCVFQDLSPVIQHGKRKSIFAQQFERSNLSRFGLTRLKSVETPEAMETCDSVVENESTKIPMESVETQESLKMDCKCSGDTNDMYTIDKENRERLAGMTEEQILAERQEILGSSGKQPGSVVGWVEN